MNTLEEFKAAVDAEVQRQINAFDIKSTVHELLNANSRRIIISAMGLVYQFGRWEVDTRKNKSSLANIIHKMSEQAAAEWLEEHANKLPKMTKTQVEGLMKSYFDRLNREISEQLKVRAQADATALVKKILFEAPEG